LIAAIKAAGYTAQVVTGQRSPAASAATMIALPEGFPLLDEALAQARRERKLMVLDFTAEWCAPCKRMGRSTFADARVKELLASCVVVKIDTDKEPEIARRLGVVGLPDIRFVSPV
jgi:thiol:disulfide interchange protein DsbD